VEQQYRDKKGEPLFSGQKNHLPEMAMMFSYFE